MSYASVYIHFVFTTKYRQPLLDTYEKRNIVWRHMKEYSSSKKIHLEIVNGYTDHCHCLVSLSRQQTLGEVMSLLKGESSHWINTNRICEKTFQWQSQYFAISVSQSLVQRVRNYIKNQEEHHRSKDFDFEYSHFVEKYGLKMTSFE